MGWIVGNGIGIPFRFGGSGYGSSYWATRYISALSCLTIGSTTQTITATIVGTGYDGVSYEYSTDNITFTEKGTSATGTYNATGLTAGTLYYWRARLYKGINYGNYFIGASDLTYHTELVTYITGLTTPLSSGQKTSLNIFIDSLKSGLSISALSDKFDALYVLAGETEESSLKNLVKNAHHATNSSTTFTAFKGFTGNGANSFINTGFASATHGVNYTLNAASIGVYISTDHNSAVCDIGARNNSVDLDGASYIFPRYTDLAITQINESGEDTFANTNSIGMYIASRNSAIQLRSYKNTTGQNKVITGGTLTDRPFYILARNNNNAAINCSANECGFAFMGGALSDANVATIRTAFLVYLNSLGSSQFSDTMGNYAFSILGQQSAQSFNGKTYIAYSGNDDDSYITTYNETTGVFATPVKLGTNPLPNGDWHGVPGLIVDHDGYIHVLFGCHNSEPVYVKSTSAEDISAWTAMTSPITSGTYIQCFELNNIIYVFFRRYAGSVWAYVTSSDNGANWSAETWITGSVAYAQFSQVGNNILCAAVGSNTTAYDLYNVFYFYFDGTNFKDRAGSNLTLPINPLTTAPTTLIYNSGSNYCASATATMDGSGNPYIFFLELSSGSGDPIGIYDYKILKYDSGWEVKSLGVSVLRKSADCSAIEVSGADLTAYLCTGGLQSLMGGNVEKWVSADSGDTWAKDVRLATGNFIMPLLVRTGIATAKLIFAEYDGDVLSFDLKGYLWGSTGFIKNTAL